MKKSILVLSILISFSVSGIFAQTDTINFSDYKLPDLKRQSLDFVYNFDNYYNNTNYSDTLTENNVNKLFQINSNFKASYSLYKNTRKYQGRQYGNINNKNYFLKNTFTPDSISEISGNKSASFSNSIILNSFNIFYFKEKYFFGANLNIGTNLYKYSYKKNDTLQNINKSNLITVSPELSIGKGRIEPVTDYVHSIYIIKNLEKENRLTEKISNEQLIRLTKLISEIKNKRFFDSRIKTIYELEKVDSFLQAEHLISEKDARYFTTLNDNWEYAGNQYRNHGYYMKFYILPRLTINNISYKNLNDTNTNTRKIILGETGITLNSYKNINLYWQRYFSVKLATSINKTLSYSDSTNFNETGKKIFALANLGYSWYPNTRTNFIFSVNTGYGPTLYNEIIPDIQTNKDNTFFINLYLTSYYYVSPRFRITVNCNSNYNYYSRSIDSFTQNKINFYFSAGIQYSLF